MKWTNIKMCGIRSTLDLGRYLADPGPYKSTGAKVSK